MSNDNPFTLIGQHQTKTFDGYVDKVRNMGNSYDNEISYQPKYVEDPYRDYDRVQSRGNVSGMILDFVKRKLLTD